jgi:hypothetical protein
MMVTDVDPQTLEARPAGPVRKVAVYAIVVLTVLLALTFIAITGIRWMLQQTPSSIVVILSQPDMTGASVIVTREGERPRPAVVIGDEAHGNTPLFLEKGAYIIRVEKAGKVIYRTDRPIYVAEGRRYDIDIASGVTSPSTRP